MNVFRRLGRVGRSLYARIALVYLASLLLLAVATAWIAISQFDRLGQEWRQRMQLDLADEMASVMRGPLEEGPQAGATHKAARLILSINPSLSLYVLNAHGEVIGDYDNSRCGFGTRVDVARLKNLLGSAPMLPEYVDAPCSQRNSVFSVARIHYGAGHRAGYLLAVFDAGPRISMFSMLRTSSITRTLILAGILALLVSGAGGLILFAMLTRRFSRLTDAVQRFAEGDYGQRITPARDDEIGRLTGAFNDMAGTIEAQLDALRENDRQRRELVANLSHDFRTPLTSLRGYVEQMRNTEALTSEAWHTHLQAIAANTERLTRLAQQLSTLSRVDAGTQTLCIEVFSLAELAHDIAGKLSPQARDAGVTLTVHCAPDLPRVRGDLSLIDRALINLIDNAVCATPANGDVRVSAEVQGGRMTVAVSDTGIGLSAEDSALITQRFYRTAASRKLREGTGLGLSIVAEICARHGTRLSIDSAPGQGSRMQFELPLA